MWCDVTSSLYTFKCNKFYGEGWYWWNKNQLSTGINESATANQWKINNNHNNNNNQKKLTKRPYFCLTEISWLKVFTAILFGLSLSFPLCLSFSVCLSLSPSVCLPICLFLFYFGPLFYLWNHKIFAHSYWHSDNGDKEKEIFFFNFYK